MIMVCRGKELIRKGKTGEVKTIKIKAEIVIPEWFFF